ncbi:metal-sensitive transcriptional regulator [Paenibacillus hamazuiensis]|uniref:metal-sensitive transcriptional regulator n=1 Tax=Paenibacillus hamazuiensis TaxID=2936508 RepID=UPI00200E7468|nr:metal-sensitive transcriptional regulator [Paenibacillus hamazuiensis]
MNAKESTKSFPEHPELSSFNPKAKLAVEQRLNRIEGQVRGVQRQIERDEYCDKILNQIEAIHSALNAVGILLLANHLKSYVSYVASADPKSNESMTKEMLKTINILINRRDDEK